MEYTKLISLLDDILNQPSNFRTRNWVEMNDESQGDYNDEDNNNDDDNNNIKFKTKMIRSSVRDYSDAYILLKGTTIVPNTAAADAAVNNTNNMQYLKIVVHLIPK